MSISAAGAHRRVAVAASRSDDTALALTQLLDELGGDTASLVMVFFSPRHDANIVARILNERTGERGLAGSTAGELSCFGFTHDAITGIAWHEPDARASITVVPDIDAVSLVTLASVPSDLCRRLGVSPQALDPAQHLWMLLFDGLSGQEEMITPFFARYAPNASIIGGSLADEERFEAVSLVHRGVVYSNAMAAILLEYTHPFELIHHTHMEFTDHWFEVTRVSSDGRTILELDHRPAVEAYAEALGLDPQEISVSVTGRYSLGTRFRGKPFPCSIMKPLPDGAFFMAYSVQYGERLALLKPVDLVEKSRSAVEQTVQALKARGAEPEAMLLFHCLGRYIECSTGDGPAKLFEALDQAPICGLNTYGEQFASMHMNHSLAGVLFG